MDDLKHQIFISSTYLDLLEERQAAVEAVLRAGHIPAGMELFAAEDRSQLEVITSWIDESDIYALILGSRYGSIEPSSQRSYTEYEYRYALDKGKPVFAIVLSEGALAKKYSKLKAKASDAPDKLAEFRKFVMTKIVRVVDNIDQVKLAIQESIQTIRKNRQLSGWSRATHDSRRVASEIARLTSENSQLKQEIAKRGPASPPDDIDVSRWLTTLRSMDIKSPKSWGNNAPKKLTLLDALLGNSGALASGVTNSSMASEHEGWLFGIASELMSLGLAEFGKVPPSVHWVRIHLSKEGKTLVAALNHAIAATKKPDAKAPKDDNKKSEK